MARARYPVLPAAYSFDVIRSIHRNCLRPYETMGERQYEIERKRRLSLTLTIVFRSVCTGCYLRCRGAPGIGAPRAVKITMYQCYDSIPLSMFQPNPLPVDRVLHGVL